MIEKITALLAASLITSSFSLAVFNPLLVRAHESDTTHTEPALVQPDESTLKDRVEKHKLELRTKLDKAQETRLKGRCKAAQANIAKAKVRSEEVKNRRLAHYAKLQERVDGLVTKLSAAGFKVDDITSGREQVAVKVEALKTSFTTYQQALDDAAAIDCVSDPTGFKATLDAARKLHGDLGKSYADLRKTIADVLLPAINASKVQINKSTNKQEKN